MLHDEAILTFTEAAKALPPLDGRRVHSNTLWRWARRGIRDVRLEVQRLGGRFYTSKEALERFTKALAEVEIPDRPAARNAIRFIESELFQSKGAKAREPFLLERWQQAIVGNLFGWKRPVGTRRYRQCLIFVGRKNGKSPLAAMIIGDWSDAPAEHRALSTTANPTAGILVPNPLAASVIDLARWRRLRLAILSRDGGLCTECNRHGRVNVATEVDHVTPKAQGATDAWDNLQSLCRSCHSRKTATEQRAGS